MALIWLIGFDTSMGGSMSVRCSGKGFDSSRQFHGVRSSVCGSLHRYTTHHSWDPRHSPRRHWSQLLLTRRLDLHRESRRPPPHWPRNHRRPWKFRLEIRHRQRPPSSPRRKPIASYCILLFCHFGPFIKIRYFFNNRLSRWSQWKMPRLMVWN